MPAQNHKDSIKSFFRGAFTEKENIIINQITDFIIETGTKLFNFHEANSKSFVITSRFNEPDRRYVWHTDSKISQKDTIGVFVTIPIFGESTCFVLNGNKNLKRTEDSLSKEAYYYTYSYENSDISNAITIHGPKIGEAAIALACNIDENIEGSIHSIPVSDGYHKLDLETLAKTQTPYVSTSHSDYYQKTRLSVIFSFDLMPNEKTLEWLKTAQNSRVITPLPILEHGNIANSVQLLEGSDQKFISNNFNLLFGYLFAEAIKPAIQCTNHFIKEGKDEDFSCYYHYKQSIYNIISGKTMLKLATSQLIFTASTYLGNSLFNSLTISKISTDIVELAINGKIKESYQLCSSDYASEILYYAVKAGSAILINQFLFTNIDFSDLTKSTLTNLTPELIELSTNLIYQGIVTFGDMLNPILDLDYNYL